MPPSFFKKRLEPREKKMKEGHQLAELRRDKKMADGRRLAEEHKEAKLAGRKKDLAKARGGKQAMVDARMALNPHYLEEKKAKQAAKLLQYSKKSEKRTRLNELLDQGPTKFVSRKLVRRAMGKDTGREKFDPLQRFFATQDELREFAEAQEDGVEPHGGVDKLGLWQLEVLRSQGCKPSDAVLDVGCGDLREGVPLIRFLEPGNYVGVDLAGSALLQGLLSLTEDEIEYRRPALFLGGDFGFERIERTFDWVWAHSVFTHINLSMVGKCLASAFAVMTPGGRFMASFFAAPSARDWAEPISYRKSSEATGYDSDKNTQSYRNPFHHRPIVLQSIAEDIGYSVKFPDEKNIKGQAFIHMTRPQRIQD